MIGLAALLMAQAAASPSMDVFPDQFSGALAICRDQVARPALAGDALADNGWPKVMSQGPDEAGYLMLTYRHPTTMLMISLIHDPANRDECIVTAPTGPHMSPEAAAEQVGALFGKRRGGHWNTDGAEIRQDSMPAGMRFIFTKKGP